MPDRWLLLLLFLNLASHYLLIGLGSSCGPEPVTEAVEGQLSKRRASRSVFSPDSLQPGPAGQARGVRPLFAATSEVFRVSSLAVCPDGRDAVRVTC